MDPRRLLPALTALACTCVVVTLVLTLSRPGELPTPQRRTDPAAVPTSPGTGPARILAEWDARRAAAWAEGDADALRDLYAAGSGAGAADVRLLRDYLRRGLTVEGLRTQLLALDVIRRSTSRLVLVVTDRVVAGLAVGGASPVALPADRASTRRIVMVRRNASSEEWRVAEARDQARPAASTSRTSSSSKS